MNSMGGHPAFRTRHVQLRVTDLQRSTAFYRELLGFHVTVDGRSLGLPVVWLTAGDHRHHIALTAFLGGRGARSPREGDEPGWVAVRHTDPIALTEAVIRLVDRGYPISRAAYHDGVMSICLADPDGNGIELRHERPRSTQRRVAGRDAGSESLESVDLVGVLMRRARGWPLS